MDAPPILKKERQKGPTGPIERTSDACQALLRDFWWFQRTLPGFVLLEGSAPIKFMFNNREVKENSC
jgi:hypothetical protein